MLTFTEDNISTLESDLLEELGLPEKFVVSAMFYNGKDNKVLCSVRKLTPCANHFLTLDYYTLTVDDGSGYGYFSITEIVNDGHPCDFRRQVARFRPGYELELVNEE